MNDHYISLILDAPMMSFSLNQPYRVKERHTEVFVTKSSIIGLIGNAKGKDRLVDDDYIEELSDLDFTIVCYSRNENGPKVDYDYHSIGSGYSKEMRAHYGVINYEGKNSGSNIIKHKYFLSGALFFVIIKGQKETLEDVHLALMKPKRQLFIGRKSFIPCSDISMGVYETVEDVKRSIEEYIDNRNKILTNKWVPFAKQQETKDFFEGKMIYDNPNSFNPMKRKYTPRFVKVVNINELDI